VLRCLRCAAVRLSLSLNCCSLACSGYHDGSMQQQKNAIQCP
jgi:hypothetical protein